MEKTVRLVASGVHWKVSQIKSFGETLRRLHERGTGRGSGWEMLLDAWRNPDQLWDLNDTSTRVGVERMHGSGRGAPLFTIEGEDGSSSFRIKLHPLTMDLLQAGMSESGRLPERLEDLLQ